MAHRHLFIVLVVGIVAISVAAQGLVGTSSASFGMASSHPGTVESASDGFTPISECQKITEPGRYRLVEDIINSSENLCIVIQASDVYFDGAGNTIDGVDKYLFTEDDGTGSTKGILAKNGPNTNVTVTNVTVTDYGYGLWYGETSNGRIVNSTFRSNGIYGIYVGYAATNNVIAHNRIRNIRNENLSVPGDGIVVANHAHENVVVDNTVQNIEQFGIENHGSNNAVIANNTVLNAGSHGIRVGVSSGVQIVDNYVNRSRAKGIRVAKSRGILVGENKVINSAEQGISLARTNDSLISQNLIEGESEFGVLLVKSRDTVISRNQVKRARIGIRTVYIQNTTVVRNIVTGAEDIGIDVRLEATSTEIRSNTISDAGRGIRLFRNGNNHLDNNTLANNEIGVLLQTTGEQTLQDSTLRDNSEHDIKSREQSDSFTVENAVIGAGIHVSLKGQNVAIFGTPQRPTALPERTHAVTNYLKIGPQPGDSWVKISIHYDGSSVSSETAIGLWTYSGEWTKRPSSTVDQRQNSLTTNLTDPQGVTYVVIAETEPETPTPIQSPTASPTSAPGQSGFGIVVALISLLGARLLAERYRE